jgi:F-type H+-transporting ATPase subunit delta
MASASASRRYARALIELAKEGAGVESIQAQLEGVAEAIDSNAELSDLVVNPVYSRSERWAALRALMQRQGASDPMLANFIHLLIDRDRIGQLGDIARRFRDLADSLAGRLRGRVTSAAPLPEDSVQAIKKSLERLTDRQVALESNVEPSLLGGVMAQVGSTVYDGSLKSHLEELRKELKQS